MNDMLQGSVVLIFIWLVVGGLGVPIPEDIALLATGVLVHRGALELPIAMIVVIVGVLAGDVMLFLLARRLGPAIYQRRPFRRLLPPQRRARIEDAYRRHGGRLVFLARHVAGLRAAVFAMAATHGMSFRRFLAWDALAACVSVPLIVALGYFGSQHADRIRQGIATGRELALLALVLALLVYVTWRRLHSRPTRKTPP
jgi:membrane protein DedA with SNARE-associated domain